MFIRRALIVGICILLQAAAFAAPVAARPLTGGISRADMAEYLKAKGYTVNLATDSHGEEILKTSVVGVNFDVYFYECDGAKLCQAVQFAAGWNLDVKPSPDILNAWNKEKRFIRAYADESGALFGEMDLIVYPTSTTEQIDAYLKLWEAMLPDFKERFSL